MSASDQLVRDQAARGGGIASSISRVLGLNQSRQPHSPTRAPTPKQQQRPQSTQTPIARPPPLSEWSSPSVPDSVWCSEEFMLGVGMVIIQKNTHKIVLVYEKEQEYYFFPRGRKDIGETLEEAALREAFEESGYQANFMKHWGVSRAPAPPGPLPRGEFSTTEAIAVNVNHWFPRKNTYRGQEYIDDGGEYLIHWYLGEIPEDAVPEKGTGMSDELNYEARLFTFEEALQKVEALFEKKVLQYAWAVYKATLERELLIGEQYKKTAEKEKEKELKLNTLPERPK